MKLTTEWSGLTLTNPDLPQGLQVNSLVWEPGTPDSSSARLRNRCCDWEDQKPRQSQRACRYTSWRPPPSSSLSPQSPFQNVKQLLRDFLFFPAVQNGKAPLSYFIRTSLRDEKGSQLVGFSLTCCLLLGGGIGLNPMSVSRAGIVLAFPTHLPNTPIHHCPRTYYPSPQVPSTSSLTLSKRPLPSPVFAYRKYRPQQDLHLCSH